jgi:hypothetical protein
MNSKQPTGSTRRKMWMYGSLIGAAALSLPIWTGVSGGHVATTSTLDVEATPTPTASDEASGVTEGGEATNSPGADQQNCEAMDSINGGVNIVRRVNAVSAVNVGSHDSSRTASATQRVSIRQSGGETHVECDTTTEDVWP